MISLIVADRNCASYLEATLRSLAQQTMRRERYEVVVVDDSSSDATPAWITAHPRLYNAAVLCRQGPGRYRAWFEGLRICCSQRVMFVRAGDVLAPNALSILGHGLDCNAGASVAYCNRVRRVAAPHRNGNGLIDKTTLEAGPWEYRRLLEGDTIGQAALIRVDALPDFDYGLDAPQRGCLQAWDVWLAMAWAGKAGMWVKEPLVSSWLRQDEEPVPGRLEASREYILAKHGINVADLKEAQDGRPQA